MIQDVSYCPIYVRFP